MHKPAEIIIKWSILTYTLQKRAKISKPLPDTIGPGIFGTTLETIPAQVPYIYADRCKADYWRKKLAGDNFKVGIVWGGRFRLDESDGNRGCEAGYFARLTAIPGVSLYGLQKGPTANQIRDFSDEITITNLGDEFEDFTDTAAAIKNLDLIISVDTSVLHLAGAMGKPAWALLRFAGNWRWLLDTQEVTGSSPVPPNSQALEVKRFVRNHSCVINGKPDRRFP